MAAITIQRHIRGFLARIATEQDFIFMTEKKSEVLIFESSKQALTIMLNLGVVLVPATILIQKAYKRYVIKKKIYRFKLLYEKLINDRMEVASSLLKKGFQVIQNKIFVKEIKFLRTRTEKLIQIKERLAILKIKNF